MPYKQYLKVTSFIAAIIIVATLLVSLAYLDYQRNKQLIIDATRLTAVNRTSLLNQYFSMMSEKVSAMVLTFQNEYEKALKSPTSNIDVQSLISEQNQYRLYGNVDFESGASLTMYSFLTVKKSLDLSSPKTLAELSAALALDSQFESLLDNLEHPEWAYFISQSGFKLIAPNSIDFDESDYQRPFYQQAAPELNPSGAQIVTDLYNDAESKGLMITISEPVYIDQRFIGVISVDIGIEFILEILASGDVPGASIVFNHKGNIVAKTGDLKPNLKVPFNFNDLTLPKEASAVNYLRPVWGGTLFIAHLASVDELEQKAIKTSLYSWVNLALGSLMLISLVFWLKEAKRNEYLMRTDPLTGLKNRRGFSEALKPIKAHLVRTKKPCALLLMDIDKFKRINDTHGHNVGDRVIESVAKDIVTSVRQDSICARWGGEEFVMFLPNTAKADAVKIAQRIRQSIEENVRTSKKLTVTISIGVYACSATEEIVSMAYFADEALYQAKKSGRNRVEVSAQCNN